MKSLLETIALCSWLIVGMYVPQGTFKQLGHGIGSREPRERLDGLAVVSMYCSINTCRVTIVDR